MTATTGPTARPDFVEVGRQAFRAGQPMAPALNPTVRDALTALEVGEGAAQIMREFQQGWTEANLAADWA